MPFFERVRRAILRPRPQPTILMYHRVADLGIDPWELAVSPVCFEQQLAVVRRVRHPMAMSEFVARLEDGTLPGTAVALTFDDGYVDNLVAARPCLASADVPATLFLASGFVGQRRDYWWDELARGILGGSEREAGEVHVGTTPVSFAFSAARPEPGWHASDPPQTERQRVYLTLYRLLRRASHEDRERAMAELRGVLQIPSPGAADLPMDADQVRTLMLDGLFELGGHTATHAYLPQLPAGERRREIREGRVACERIVGRRVAGFAYPHGALDEDSKAAVRECGLEWACSTVSRPVGAGELDLYALPRIAVRNWDGPEFERALEHLAA